MPAYADKMPPPCHQRHITSSHHTTGGRAAVTKPGCFETAATQQTLSTPFAGKSYELFEAILH